MQHMQLASEQMQPKPNLLSDYHTNLIQEMACSYNVEPAVIIKQAMDLWLVERNCSEKDVNFIIKNIDKRIANKQERNEQVSAELN